MSSYVFQAKDLLEHRRGARSAAFKTALMSAMGHLALQSRHALIKDTLAAQTCGWITFYPNDDLIYRAPRVSVRFMRKSRSGSTACAIVEVEYMKFFHGRGPMEVKVQFPDDLQGLSGLLGDEEETRFNGLFFNLTPGEYKSNLFEAVNTVCDAFECAEAMGADKPAPA